MFDQKNLLSKYVGYFLIGFFLLIIILSFGMPDLGLNCGIDRSTVAIVNREKIHAYDFFRYRDTRFSQLRNRKMDSMILDNLILETLLYQKAVKTGMNITEERLSRYIKGAQEFKNPSTGLYDPEYFSAILRNNRLSLAEFEKLMRRDFIIADFRYMLRMGSAVTKEEIDTKHILENSEIQIQYSFLDTEELKKQHNSELAVTDAEIESEIKNKNVKMTDPTTDKDRIKKQISEKKLEKIKNDIAEKNNAVSSSGGTFVSENFNLKGKISKSNIFKIGEPIKTDEKDPKPVQDLNSSPVFNEKCLQLEKDKSSPAIITTKGIYIFTPIHKVIPADTPDAEAAKKISDTAGNISASMVTRNLLQLMEEKSKIIKNLKTD
jgi:hypothetical protein